MDTLTPAPPTGTGDDRSPPRDPLRRRQIVAAAIAVVGLALAAVAWLALGSGDDRDVPSEVAVEAAPAVEPDDAPASADEADDDPPASTTFTRERGVALGLTLDAATVTGRSTLDDGLAERVRVTFGTAVGTIVEPDGFAVVTALGDDVTSVGARVVDDAAGVVHVDFPDGTDLARYDSVTVTTDAVRTHAGEANIASSAPLAGGGAAAGVTVRPELTAVDVDVALDRVTYRFDADLATAPPPADAFTATTARGAARLGAAVVAVDGTDVVVAFDAPIDDAVRFAVRERTVEDRLGRANIAGATGGRTAAPAPVDATRAPGAASQFDVTFRPAVEDVDPAAFSFVTVTGEDHPARASQRIDTRTVRLTVPGVADAPDAVVAVSLAPGAVRDLADGLPSGADSVPVATGTTAAPPELSAVEPTDVAGRVGFRFSAPLHDATTPAPAALTAVTADGPVPADRVVDVDGATVTVDFDRPAVAAAEAFGVAAGAVADRAGQPNPQGLVPAPGSEGR